MYVCPMHHEVQQTKPGTCHICHMALVKENKLSQTDHEPDASYRPLIIIISLITLTTISLAFSVESFNMRNSMSHFMAGFFLVFSGFKLLDLKGFAEAYGTYDLLAMRTRTYGYVYPFIELALGLSYMVGIDTPMLHLTTLIIMAFSGVGVALKLAKHERFRCACLGTFLKVPLTQVTLIEDFGMATMAAMMLMR